MERTHEEEVDQEFVLPQPTAMEEPHHEQVVEDGQRMKKESMMIMEYMDRRSLENILEDIGKN